MVNPILLMSLSYRSLSLLLTVAAFFCFSVSTTAQTTNGILREVFSNIAGTAITDLTSNPNYPNNPTIESIEQLFEAPTDFGDNYGTRMQGILTAPVTGNYIFWIASDDSGRLFLSTNASPVSKRLIAAEPQWAAARDWDGNVPSRTNATAIFPSMNPNLPANRSDYAVGTITLTAGQRYYIEALQKEGSGGDNLAVGWQIPGGTLERPIPAARVEPFGLGPPSITRQPVNTTGVEGGTAIFSVTLARMLGSVFQWSRNGTNIPGATNSSVTVGPLSLADHNASFSVFVANGYGTTNSANAFLTVTADTTQPTISSVGNLGNSDTISVTFSEPVEASSAGNSANYQVNNGVTVLRATLGTDLRTVVLTTTPIPSEITNTLTVNNVRDRASTPNTILPNSQRTFSVSIRPIDPGFLTLPRESLGPSSRRHGVVISEVMFHPAARSDSNNLEFIEIYNSQAWFEEIGGWRISGAIDYVFPSNTVIQSRSYLVVAANPTHLRTVFPAVNPLGPFLNTNGLQNSSGTLRLRNAQDAVLFEMDYASDPPFPAAADGGGHSLVLARPSYGEGDPRAWAASATFGGSPGLSDGVNNQFNSILINELLAHTDDPDLDYVEIYNYGNASIDLSGAVLTDDPATNKFIFPTNSIIPARGFLGFNQNQLGFALSSDGETVFLKSPGATRVIDAVKFEAQENGVAWGRYPDGASSFSRMPKSGHPNYTNNLPPLLPPVVINEIMYDPISTEEDDEYIELLNRGSTPVNLSGWRIRDAVSYNIPPGTVVAPGAFLVIAKNAARLRTNYLQLNVSNTIGNFSGSLRNKGERIELNMPDEVVSTNQFGVRNTNIIHIMVDEVAYRSGGRWGTNSAGGGSSLELRDSRADRRLAANWADSDETSKSQWVTVESTGVMDNGWADAFQLHITLMGPGECLIDNVEVIRLGTTNMIANSTFENGTGGWVFQGNHNQSSLEAGEGFASSRSLHLRAAGRGDTGANRIRTQLPFTIAPGTVVTLRAKARWLKGNPNLLLRLRGNWFEAPGTLLTAKNLGTPAQANSTATSNVGPSISDVRHDPPLPAANQRVVIVAKVNDPDGLANLTVQYRIDPSTNYQVVPMTNNGAGLFSTALPGQAAGTLAAFFIQAMDNAASPASSTFPAQPSQRECLVRWGDNATPRNLGTYRFWISSTNVNRWSSEEKMSNNPKDVTFIYGSTRVIYNAGAWFHGSPYHSPSYNSPIGNSCDYDLNFPADEPFLGDVEINLFRPGNGGGDGTGQAEIHGYWFGNQFGIPFLYHRPVFVYVNGVQREVVFHDAQQPNGDFIDQWFPDDSDGDLHKIQLGFEFGDLAYGANEPGYAVVGANLNRYTTTGGILKQARYRQTWALRSASVTQQNDYTNLFALVNAAMTSAPVGSDAYTTILTAATDVEEWFKVHVTQHLYNNPDSFSYGGGQNAFAYKPQSDAWKLFLWDIDFAFGGSPTDSNLLGIGGADHGPRNDHPPFARIYWQALIEAANGMLTAARSNPILDSRYSGMLNAGAAVGSPAGIKSFIAARRTYILSQIASNQAPFAIRSNNGADFTTNRNLITLTGTAPLDARTLLVNGQAYPVTWTSRTTWVIRVPLLTGTNTLRVTGIDPKGLAVAGVDGTIRVNFTGVSESPAGRVVINEIMYNPAKANASFVELYNSSTANAFDLSGWEIEGLNFIFPNGSIIEPGQYLVLAKDRFGFADAYGNAIPVLAEFADSLDNGGETLTLLRPSLTGGSPGIIDQVTYDDVLPWPLEADGGGPSLQLIDPLQDNDRVANWGIVSTNGTGQAPVWRYVSITGTATSSSFYMYLQSPGEIYVDDLKFAAGLSADGSPNLLSNGDFEAAFPGSWVITASHSGSALSSTVKHGGNYSLRVVANTGGATRGTSIYQDFVPALLTNQPYTLSFWYLQTTNTGGTLTLRLSGNGVLVDVPYSQASALNRFTPGASNSVRTSRAPFAPLWINEVLPNNVFSGTNGMTDRFGERDPWLELYNGGSTTLNLTGYYLANNYTNLGQWAFPANTQIAAGQFLLVWLDGEPAESIPSELHANFRAATNIGTVVLSTGTNLFSSVLDYYNYSIPSQGRSFGSYPDGRVSGRRIMSIPTPQGSNNPASPLVNVRINEWMAQNNGFLADEFGSFDDWFELYNPGTNDVDLTGYYLSDSLTNATQWKIPDGTILPSGGFLLVWADNDPDQNTGGDLHAGFALSRTGDAIGLFAPDRSLVDGIQFGIQLTNVSQGRFPDGNVPIYSMTNPTPRAQNLVANPNYPPRLSPIGNRSVDEGGALTIQLEATDTNFPPQSLTFSMEGAPSGAVLQTNTGAFNWVPSESQGPGIFTVTFRVTDNGSPSMSATQSVQITVNEANNSPVLTVPLSVTLNEGSSLLVTNSATDSDTPAQTLTYSLGTNTPAGVTIDPVSGVVRWTTTESHGPGDYSIEVVVTDNGLPPKSERRNFSVLVNEVNSAPQPTFTTTYSGAIDNLLGFTATATDSDLPAQALTYTLEPGAPAGSFLDPSSGAFSWTPTSAQVGTNDFQIRISDSGSPSLFTLVPIRVTVIPSTFVVSIAPAGNQITLSFPTIPGRTYRVESKDRLTDTWQPLGGNRLADAVFMTVNDLRTLPYRFYQVVNID